MWAISYNFYIWIQNESEDYAYVESTSGEQYDIGTAQGVNWGAADYNGAVWIKKLKLTYYLFEMSSYKKNKDGTDLIHDSKKDSVLLLKTAASFPDENKDCEKVPKNTWLF